MGKRMDFGTGQCDHPVVTVDVVIFALRDNDLQVLLIRRRRPPFLGMWAIPGGPVARDEELEAAAERELAAETGLSDVYLEQLYTFGEPERDPRHRVITVSYFALVPANALAPFGEQEAEHARWWSLEALPSLAFDHAAILQYALRRLRYKLEYTAAGFELLPDEFTLTELQTAYETVLGEELDKRNFRRKILSAGIIEASGQHRCGEGRPARLYRYRPQPGRPAGAIAEGKARRLFP